MTETIGKIRQNRATNSDAARALQYKLKILLNCDGLGILCKVLHHNLDTKRLMA
jgi:hypothetical protein